MRFVSTVCLLALAAAGVGCAGVDVAPIVSDGVPFVDDQNPVYIALGKESYGTVFENVLTVLGDYGFQFERINRYDGRVETKPRCAPGLGLFLKPGSPDLYQRALSTAQSYRHRLSVVIHPADQGGYFIEVVALKDIEDLPRPIKSTIGSATFRTESDLDRDYDVIDRNRTEAGWINKGRDPALEQEIIRRMKKLM